MKKSIVSAFSLLLLALSSSAQQHRFNPDTLLTVVIDSPVNIRSHRLNAQDFIDAVVADTGFYKAFRNMKRYGFMAANDIYTYDKHNQIEGEIHRRVKHTVVAGRPKTEYLFKQDKGKVYKRNGKYDLYTVEMFDYIFNNAYNSAFSAADPLAGAGKNGSYKDKLKTLIFSPGRKVTGIPFLSGKTEIFGPDMRQFYNYEFARGKYLDSIPVYRFKVIKKPSTADGDVMIKELTTIFDMRTFKILGRYVDMRYGNLFFDFDVKMNIELVPYNDELLPAKISYQGSWNVPFHKEERASFLILQKDYHK
ncbi:hypothetical protein [Mucilaginibacter sp. UR6-11]|uniref:hypothetical protein n=1 Tax=Mucilaginibacter sp. UR6-11 TaxID=1435644 RepID=UPI001E57D736|nr:hypothetical protein [Mucilaginibacter sp. UR6-11]MCC8425113.1 hypothetical protein [Mucilaginibacter sp. UR6-11]